MSFGGLAASTSGWCTRPGERGIGSTGCAGRHRSSLLTGLYAMATAEHREPCDSRGSCTVLGAPGGETPSGDSSKAASRAAKKGEGGWPLRLMDERPKQLRGQDVS